jgi:RTX calcium-binding nonapeptide repeat (4 copies)
VAQQSLAETLAHLQVAFARALRSVVLLAVLAGLMTVPAANAVTYPVAGGNRFDADKEGWTGEAATCSSTVGSLCTEQNLYSGAQGNPPGSIESRMDVYLNAGGYFAGQATWRSPTFEATASGQGSLRYERQLDSTGLAALLPTSSVEAVLVHESSGQPESLDSEQLNSANSTFAAHTIFVPEGTLFPGHRYHLELRSTTTTNAAQAGLTGSASVRFDNVALAVENTGLGGSSGSPGVQFTGPPLSQKHISKLATRVRWAAEVGHLAGGSVLKPDQCTILGTPHADHIRGSTGNDVICGLGGNDKINGRGGRDIIDGGNGNDRLSGSKGNDILAGLRGRDRLGGGPGSDRAGGGAGAERASGASGNDRLKGGSGDDRLLGGPGKDRISGGPGRNRVSGGPGLDRISGGRSR